FDRWGLTSHRALPPLTVVGGGGAGVRREPPATGGMILLLLIMAFMMIEAQRYPAKLHDALAMDEDRESAVNGFVRSLRSYVVLNSVFGLAAAVLNTIVLFALGVDFALLWGVASFLLSFLPNVGFVLALVPPALLALLEFGLARSLMVIVAFTAVNLVVDTVIKPRMVGESLDLSPFVVVISLVFWGWLLGPVGALLAVPLSVGLKFLFEAFDESRWLAHLLSDKSPSADSGPPSAPG
ncbi:MAG: AI-2E family transporter, partial [Gemmatimonadota bacterium]